MLMTRRKARLSPLRSPIPSTACRATLSPSLSAVSERQPYHHLLVRRLAACEAYARGTDSPLADVLTRSIKPEQLERAWTYFEGGIG